ncbi:MAG: FecR domain-containing protein [Bacteroidota bacterium]
MNRRWLSIAAGLLLVFSLAWCLWPSNIIAVELSTVITGVDEERELILADGSTVWLNENSKLTFPKQFPEDSRLVQLVGEAFLSVKKNPEAPFKIQTTTAAEVEVLGTSFLVQAPMAAEQVLIEVASGTVRLQGSTTDQQVVLNAGERGTWSAEGDKVQKSETANPNSYAWQTDILIFDETSLVQVAKDLEQYFKVSIKVQRNLGVSCVVSGRFPEPNIDDIIVAITRSLGLEWSTAGADRYRITGNACN